MVKSYYKIGFIILIFLLIYSRSPYIFNYGRFFSLDLVYHFEIEKLNLLNSLFFVDYTARYLNIISNISDQMRNVSLDEATFPFFENPLIPSARTETPVTPNTLNLPGIDSKLISNTVNNSNFNNLTTEQKLAILFNQN